MSRQVNLGQIVPNVQVGTTTTINPGLNARVENVGTELNPILNFYIPKGDSGAIKMMIVAELPATGEDDTIYLVPLESPESQENNYAEYVYINDNWELLGKIGIQVDLTDYYTKTETNSLLDTKQALIDSSHKLSSDLVDDTNKTNKFVTDTDKTNWNDKISPTDYASSSKGGVLKVGSGLEVNSSNGYVFATNYNYSTYNTASNNNFISKGTLENVITGKDLTTKAYVDGLVGDIGTALDSINGEVI